MSASGATATAEYPAGIVFTDFASVLANHRCKSGLTQRELSAKAGLSQDYVNQLENHRFLPTYTTLQLLAQALNLHPGVFFPSIY